MKTIIDEKRSCTAATARRPLSAISAQVLVHPDRIRKLIIIWEKISSTLSDLVAKGWVQTVATSRPTATAWAIAPCKLPCALEETNTGIRAKTKRLAI